MSNEEMKQGEDSKGVIGKLYVVPSIENGYIKLTDVEELEDYKLGTLKKLYHNVFLAVLNYNYLDDLSIREGFYKEEYVHSKQTKEVVEFVKTIPIIGLINSEELLEMLIRKKMTDEGFEEYKEELLEEFAMLRAKVGNREN